ncbi:Vacuolar Protein Sorting-Associated Protein 13D [Manis pentadactyla]|nr:Vacuolar Protein Sorting-Associated Protein 13D [Manis pentadactyla]
MPRLAQVLPVAFSLGCFQKSCCLASVITPRGTAEPKLRTEGSRGWGWNCIWIPAPAPPLERSGRKVKSHQIEISFYIYQRLLL